MTGASGAMSASRAPSSTEVGLCGLGPMGLPIAIRLAEAGAAPRVWNRTPGKAAEAVAAGAVEVERPAGAARPVTLTVLPDLPQVEELVFRADGLLAGWEEQGIGSPVLVVHGTISPVAVADFAERMLAEHGVRVVDAPMSGGTIGAARGTLSLMVGGEESAIAEVLPVFEHYGRTVRVFGASGTGALAKLCNQVIVASTVTAISEALLLARRAGLDQQALIEILSGGLASSEVLSQKSVKWLTDDYAEGGSGKNQLKDLRFVAEAARAQGLELPVAHVVEELFADMVESGSGDLDHTGIIQTIARRSDAGEARS